MTRGVRLYLVGSFVLVSLAGCGRGFFQAEREPWRAEAEVACLKSGVVKESADVVRISPISGPGVCGADFPLKVAALGESTASLGFADENLRPPGDIGNPPRWPVRSAPPSAYQPPRNDPQSTYRSPASTPDAAPRPPAYGQAPSGPISLAAPGVPPEEDEIDLPEEGTPGSYPPPRATPPSGAQGAPPREPYSAPYAQPPYTPSSNGPASLAPDRLPPLGPPRGDPVTAVGPVAVKPTATLACPIVSVLDRWLADSVQPAAQRWFGAHVVEIKQISAYSCRGMNGNPSAHISEHAFGNALDIAAFTLADGRRISVKDGWHGLPEEQGFLRDVQAAACAQFNTVLAPGSNAYHYDHIHVDLMRRASGRIICEPAAISGGQVAARAQQRYGYGQRDPSVTGSLSGAKEASHRRNKGERVNEDDEFEDD
jgi:Extensin-like protein C-terminus